MADFSTFRLISFDADLLGSYFNARTVARTVSAIQNTAHSIKRGPATITPWALDESRGDRTLAGKFNAVRGKTDFIDLNARSIRQTNDKDEQALFALYRALNDLKTIADYAADDTTPPALLAKLNSQFRGGLDQVQDYIRTAELDKLTLMFGEKKSRLESDLSLGRNDAQITGATLPVSARTQEIPGLTGTEVFTLNLDNAITNNDIVMDLSQMTEPLTLNNLRNFFNLAINAITVPDEDGNPVSKYRSRFGIKEVSPGKFALTLNVQSSEKITLTAQASEPALYITGTHKDAGFGETEIATLIKLRALDGNAPLTEFSRQIAGTDQRSILPPLTDDDGNEIDNDAEQFKTRANATAIDSQGNVYVVGSSRGDFGNQINAAEDQDVFLSKYDAVGNLLFSRLLGASGHAEAFDIAIDNNDNVFIAGQVNNELAIGDVLSGLDSFVTKYDHAGLELWSYQQDTVATDQANSIAIDANGDVFVTGSISGQLSTSATYGGKTDIFVTKLSGADGSLSGSAQIGGAGIELGEAIAIAGDGNILIASREDGNLIIRKLDATDLTSQLASYDLGDLGGGTLSDIVVDDAGDIYVAGSSFNAALSGGTVTNAHSGDTDGFVTKLSDNGTSLSAVFTHFIGSDGADRIEGLTVQNGAIYVAGKTTGTLPGGRKTGTTDGFAAKIDSTSGTADFVRQFGGITGHNGSTAIAFSAAGTSVLTRLGLPAGLVDYRQERDIETQTSIRAGDHFYISVNGGRLQKVTINEGDDFKSLATRIRRLSYRYIDAKSVVSTDDNKGQELRIETRNGSIVDVLAGKGARDALIKLGMQPTKILSPEALSTVGDASLGTDPDNLGGTFDLKLLSAFSLRSKKEAEFVSAQINTALETIRRAFRSLTYDPVKAKILRDADLKKGTVPVYLSKQLSNYQAGLNKLTSLGYSTGLSI